MRPIGARVPFRDHIARYVAAYPSSLEPTWLTHKHTLESQVMRKVQTHTHTHTHTTHPPDSNKQLLVCKCHDVINRPPTSRVLLEDAAKQILDLTRPGNKDFVGIRIINT